MIWRRFSTGQEKHSKVMGEREREGGRGREREEGGGGEGEREGGRERERETLFAQIG